MKRWKVRPWMTVLAMLLLMLAGYRLLRPRPARWRGCNVVWIVSDALRRDVLGCYGGGAHTPHIDWLARNGVRFESAYANAPTTLPSSLSLLTGRYSSSYFVGGPRHGGIFWVNAKDQLLAEALRERGYDAVMNLENPLVRNANSLQGFRDARRFSLSTRPRHRQRGPQPADPRDGPAPGRPRSTFDKLLHYLATAPKNRPFMALNWFYDPHAPYDPPRRYLERIPTAGARFRVAPGAFLGKSLTKIKEEFQERNIPLNGAEHEYLVGLYKAEVEWVDERIGRILDILRRRDMLRRTILIFTADHGELLGEHGRWGHGHRYLQTLVHVPLILSAPGLRSRSLAAPVAHVDLVPTLAAMLGVAPLRPAAQGNSLLPALDDGRHATRPVYFSDARNEPEGKNGIDGVLLDGYKLIAAKDPATSTCQLFHLPTDPDELRDLAAVDPAARKKLLAVILERRREIERLRQANLRKLDPALDLTLEKEALLRDLRRLGYL